MMIESALPQCKMVTSPTSAVDMLSVNSEVQKAVNAAQSLHHRWSELLQEGGGASKEEMDWTTNELRNSLRSIEWDLEDLDETINILYKQQRVKTQTYTFTDQRVPSLSANASSNPIQRSSTWTQPS